jgi:putative FmdB family regulatory protein
MPTYDYECQSCHGKFELFQSITERPVRKCPHCGRASARRLIGAGAGIIFKGSGFYQTDYRSAAYKAEAKADSAGGSASGKSESKSESKAESKPESKPESKSESSSDTKSSSSTKKDQKD